MVLDRTVISVSLFTVALVALGCALRSGQRYSHFISDAPLPPTDTLVVGFMGGREPWDNEQRWVRKLALKLRAMSIPGLHVETAENRNRPLVLRLIHDLFDNDRDRALNADERRQIRLVLYGHSFGGAAVVKLARQLDELSIPVLLTVQVDSVGRHDALIPPNVRRAANLYQRDGWFIRGQAAIRADDLRKTAIVGNFRYSYQDKSIDLSHVSWFKKAFRLAHTKMGHDPEVWAKVEDLILDAVKADPSPVAGIPGQR